MVDSYGYPLAINVHSATAHDSVCATTVLTGLKEKYTRLVKVLADGGYQGKLQLWFFTHKAASLDDLIKIIAVAYQQKGYDLNDLAKIDQVGTLPPVEGCRIATEFSEALAFIDAKQSAYVFKNLIYLSEQK